MAAMLGTDGAKKTCPKMNFEMGISCSCGTIWMRPTVIHQYISKSFFSMVCVVYNFTMTNGINLHNGSCQHDTHR